MKKFFSILTLLLLTCSTVNAQYMLKVKYTDGTHDLYEIDCTDNVELEADSYADLIKGLYDCSWPFGWTEQHLGLWLSSSI